ncbi:MAG: hypothetical protein HXY25_10275 [Alphaproteobacteria bacterium]|nr:hypothetical protein [Alphaproteobacteria bacterium]
MTARPGIAYTQVILGFHLEGETARWLTHAEIAGGVLDALAGPTARHVIGTLEPWERRPAR